MEEEYTEVVREFYALYRPLQKKHNLRYHMHFDLYNDGLIEIWEYEGEKQKRCISIAREENDIDCYRRAIDDLKHYQKDSESQPEPYPDTTPEDDIRASLEGSGAAYSPYEIYGNGA